MHTKATAMSEEMYLDTTGKLLINNFKPSYTIEMRHGTGEVSKLDFNGPKLIFTGDAEESAKVFLNYLTMIWEKRLQEEREAEREACAVACEQISQSFFRHDNVTEAHAAQDCADAIWARGEQEQPR